MNTQTTRTATIVQQPASRVAVDGLRIEGVAKPAPSMILGALINAVARAIAFAIDRVGFNDTDEVTYEPLVFTQHGPRVQSFTMIDGHTALIVGELGLVKQAGAFIKDACQALARVLEQTTGNKIGNMFFTTPTGQGYCFEAAIVNLETGAVINLAEKGFTQVVSAPTGLVAVRAEDTAARAHCRLYFLGNGQLSKIGTIESWTETNPLASAIRCLQTWRITGRVINAVPVETVDDRGNITIEYLDLSKIDEGKISSPADAHAQHQLPAISVLGSTATGGQTVVIDRRTCRTYFVPQPVFRRAATKVQQAQNAG